MCGMDDPPGLEVCPVSEREMGAGRGLTHLIAHGRHARAMSVYNGRAAITRASIAADEPRPKTTKGQR